MIYNLHDKANVLKLIPISIRVGHGMWKKITIDLRQRLNCYIFHFFFFFLLYLYIYLFIFSRSNTRHNRVQALRLMRRRNFDPLFFLLRSVFARSRSTRSNYVCVFDRAKNYIYGMISYAFEIFGCVYDNVATLNVFDIRSSIDAVYCTV